MANRIAGITVEIGGDTTKLSTALKSVNQEIRSTQQQLRDVNHLLKLDPGNTDLIAQKQRLLRDAIGETKEKLEALKSAAKQANEQLANGDISQKQYDSLQREIVETEQKLKSLEEQASKSEDALKRIAATGDSMKALGDKISGAGNTLTKTVSAPIAGLGTVAVKTAADFDSAMSKVAAVSGATGADLDTLREKAREMGSKTKFSASEAAEAMNYMAMAGWKTEDMLSGIEGIMNLAAASGEDLATTSDIVTDALTAFGLKADDSRHFADILAAASSNANTNVSMMGETFQYVAPIAGAMGYSAEETAEAIGLMANAGIKSSQAGTSLRKIMTDLNGEIKIHSASLGDTVIQTSNADGSMRSFNDILADCRVAFGNLSESEQASNAETLVGKNAMSGFLALMNAAPGDIDKLNTAIGSCSDSLNGYNGTAEQMATVMQDNLGGQLTILKSQLEELAISFGDMLMPVIRDLVSWVQEFVNKLNSMDEGTRQTIITIGLVAAALGPILIIVGKVVGSIGSILSIIPQLSSAISSVRTVMTALNATFLASPIGVVVAAIAALTAAFIYLWKTNEEFRTAITEIWNGIVENFKIFFQGIVDRLNELGFNFKDISEVIRAVWDGLCSVLAPLFEGAFKNISNILSLATDVLLGILDIFIGIFTGDWNKAWTGIKEVFAGIWEFLKDTLSNCLNTFKNVTNVFLGWFGTSWNDLWRRVKDFFVNTWNNIKNTMSNILGNIRNGVKTAFDNITSSVANAMARVFDAVRNGFTRVKDHVFHLAEEAYHWGRDMIFGIAEGIWSCIDYVSDAVNCVAERIRSVLHFSVPDEGPLTDYESWMPDFMKGLAKGIEKSRGLIKGAMNDVAGDMVISGRVSAMTEESDSNPGKVVSLDGITSLLSQYLPYLSEGSVIQLDSGALVGATAKKMNLELSRLAQREANR